MSRKLSGRVALWCILATVIGPAVAAHATRNPLNVPNSRILFLVSSNLWISSGVEGSNGIDGEWAMPSSSTLAMDRFLLSHHRSNACPSILSEDSEQSDFVVGEGKLDDFFVGSGTDWVPLDTSQHRLQSQQAVGPLSSVPGDVHPVAHGEL